MPTEPAVFGPKKRHKATRHIYSCQTGCFRPEKKHKATMSVRNTFCTMKVCPRRFIPPPSPQTKRESVNGV
jgi:hypothetical protein